MLTVYDVMEGKIMPLHNLVIDDLRSFKEEPDGVFVYARTSFHGRKALDEYEMFGVQNLWLDHDLGLKADGTDDTIMSVVDSLCLRAYEGNPYPVETIYVHTSNPVGRKNIKTSLDRWGYKSVVVFDASEFFVVADITEN